MAKRNEAKTPRTSPLNLSSHRSLLEQMGYNRDDDFPNNILITNHDNSRQRIKDILFRMPDTDDRLSFCSILAFKYAHRLVLNGVHGDIEHSDFLYTVLNAIYLQVCHTELTRQLIASPDHQRVPVSSLFSYEEGDIYILLERFCRDVSNLCPVEFVNGKDTTITNSMLQDWSSKSLYTIKTKFGSWGKPKQIFDELVAFSKTIVSTMGRYRDRILQSGQPETTVSKPDLLPVAELARRTGKTDSAISRLLNRNPALGNGQTGDERRGSLLKVLAHYGKRKVATAIKDNNALARISKANIDQFKE
jgi:hypothetical protein